MDGGQEVVGETVCRDALVHVVGAEEADRVARAVEEAEPDELREEPDLESARARKRSGTGGREKKEGRRERKERVSLLLLAHLRVL